MNQAPLAEFNHAGALSKQHIRFESRLFPFQGNIGGAKPGPESVRLGAKWTLDQSPPAPLRRSSGISRENRRIVEALHRAFREPFTAAEAAERLDLDPARARRLTRYLADRGWLDRVRRGLYLPVPLDCQRRDDSSA